MRVYIYDILYLVVRIFGSVGVVKDVGLIKILSVLNYYYGYIGVLFGVYGFEFVVIIEFVC